MIADPIRLPATLPPVPSDLVGWEWEADRYTNGAVVRLACPAEGEATDWQPPMYAEAMIGYARAIVAREAPIYDEVRAEAGARSAPAVIAEPPTRTQLTPQMQRHVDRTLAADRKGGEALWEKACAVADARADAPHGEWGRYLEATKQDERATRRLIAIAERGRVEARFRDAIITGFLNFTVASITAQADDQLLTALLDSPAPPTQREAQVRLAHPAALPDLVPPANAADREQGSGAGTSGSAAGFGAPDTERFIRADVGTGAVPADSIDAICNGLARLQGHVDAGRTIAGDLARLDALAARLARLADGYPGAEEQIATLRKALAPSPAASLAAESDDDAPLTAYEAQIAAAHPAVLTDSLAAIHAALDVINARIAEGCAGPDDLPALGALGARLGALGGDFDLDGQIFFTRHALRPFLAPWQMTNAELVIHRAAPPLDLALGDALKARGFTYRGSFLTWPDHPLGANVRQHVLFGTVLPDAAPTEQHWTDDGVQELIETMPVLTPPRAAPIAPAFDACAAAQRALADELHAASPRLVRLLLLALCFSDIPDEDDADVLRETLTDGLQNLDDAVLEWALGAAAEE